MRVSQRLDYALRALVLLAEQPSDSWTAAGDLAERLSLPKRFVEQQISALARGGIADCRRGSAGGCRLARSAEEITVREIVEALQGAVLDVPRQTYSATAEMWQEAADELSAFAESRTLAQLASRQKELDALAAPMYYI